MPVHSCSLWCRASATFLPTYLCWWFCLFFFMNPSDILQLSVWCVHAISCAPCLLLKQGFFQILPAISPHTLIRRALVDGLVWNRAATSKSFALKVFWWCLFYFLFHFNLTFIFSSKLLLIVIGDFISGSYTFPYIHFIFNHFCGYDSNHLSPWGDVSGGPAAIIL